ncbi:hypothetical protein ACO0SA_003518 [Hanseniaspora valbyensis]
MANALKTKKHKSFFGLPLSSTNNKKIDEREINFEIQKYASFEKQINQSLLPPVSMKLDLESKDTMKLDKKLSFKKLSINSKKINKRHISAPNSNITNNFDNQEISYLQNEHPTITTDLEANLLEHKIQQKLNNMLYIHTPSKLKLNLSSLPFSEKQKIYTTLTYIATIFHYDTISYSIDLEKINWLDMILYDSNYNIFEKIEDISPTSTRQVIRGLRTHFQRLVTEYSGIKDVMEIIFTVWKQFNNVFTFEKMLSIEQGLKKLFPRAGCSFSDVFLQFKLFKLFDDDSQEQNIINCFYSLLYLCLLNDGLISWNDYLQFSMIDGSLCKTLPLVIPYDNLTIIFEFLEMLIFFIGQYAYKPFEEVMQFINNFSLVLFSLENCLEVKTEHKFKDLREFKKVSEKLSNATLILLKKYLNSLAENKQLNDFYCLKKLKNYLSADIKQKNKHYSKEVLVLSQPIDNIDKLSQTKAELIATILTNLNTKQKFINEENYFVDNITIQFLKFISTNFDKFFSEMVVNDLIATEFLLDKKMVEDNKEIYNNLIYLMNNKENKLNNNFIDIRKYLFGEENQYRLSDWINIDEFSEFGQGIFSNKNSLKSKEKKTLNKLKNEDKCSSYDLNKDLNYSIVEIQHVEDWIIQCFQNNHPLIFPTHLIQNCSKIYQIKSNYAAKLGLDFVYFKLAEIKNKHGDNKFSTNKVKKEDQSNEEINTTYKMNTLDINKNNFQTPESKQLNKESFFFDSENIANENSFNFDSSKYSGKTMNQSSLANEKKISYSPTDNFELKNNLSHTERKSPNSIHCFIKQQVTPVKVNKPIIARPIIADSYKELISEEDLKSLNLNDETSKSDTELISIACSSDYEDKNKTNTFNLNSKINPSFDNTSYSNIYMETPKMENAFVANNFSKSRPYPISTPNSIELGLDGISISSSVQLEPNSALNDNYSQFLTNYIEKI